MAEDNEPQSQPVVEPPRGMHNGRLDDKGRLKLPVQFQAYLNSFSEKKLFVTSTDRRTAQIYPISVWRQNEKLLHEFRQLPKVARKVAFNANDLGADADMDSQGRVLFNPELRRALDMENHGLRLYCFKGHIQVLTEAVYQAQLKDAEEDAVENVYTMEEFGLQ